MVGDCAVVERTNVDPANRPSTASATTVVFASVVWVPSVAVTEMVAPTSPTPLIEVLVSLAKLIGLVTVSALRTTTRVKGKAS